MEDDDRVEDEGGGLRGESSRPAVLPRPPELAFRDDEAAGGGGGGGALQKPPAQTPTPQSSSNNFSAGRPASRKRLRRYRHLRR